MDYITINEAFTAVIAIPESTNTDTVTYTVYKASDGSVFASGSAAFVAGINWRVTFTPAVDKETYIVEVNDTTLDVKLSQSFRCARKASMTAEVATTETVTNQTLLDKVNTAIQARLNGGAVQSYSISGRNIQYATLDELFRIKDKLERAVNNNADGGLSFASFDEPG
jgi:hypothetical protein